MYLTMGSLPNLNDLREQQRLKNEYDPDPTRAFGAASVAHQDKALRHERLQLLAETSHSGTADIGGQMAGQRQRPRSSLVARKVHRTHSSGTTNHIWDDPQLEHMMGDSSIGACSIRATASANNSNTAGPTQQPPPLLSYHQHQQQQQQQQQQQHFTASRRRDSINSSIGANSIRHLLTLKHSTSGGGGGGGGSGHAGCNYSADARCLSGTGSSSGTRHIRHSSTSTSAGCRHKIPEHIRAKVARNFLILCTAHALACAILLPFFGLQASTTVWLHQASWLRLGPNFGSLLLAVACLTTAVCVLGTQRALQRIGYVPLLVLAYVALCVFLLAHVYPCGVWTLLPAYVLLGVALAPAGVSKWNLVVFFASRTSCGQQECCSGNSGGGGGMMVSEAMLGSGSNQMIDGLGDGGGGGGVGVLGWNHCNRDERVRRMGRWYHGAESAGIVVGALLASLVMTTCARWGCEVFATPSAVVALPDAVAGIEDELLRTATTTVVPPPPPAFVDELSTRLSAEAAPPPPAQRPTTTTAASTTDIIGTPVALLTVTTDEQQQLQLDAMFGVNVHGKRICGADACPMYGSYGSYLAALLAQNRTLATLATRTALDSHPGATLLVLIHVGLSVAALALTISSAAVDNTFRRPEGGTRSWTDTIMFAGPMAFFIGTEQAYVLGDFTKAFVACSLGTQTVAGALVGMGLMQMIVGCTLSMLLRHTKRYAVLTAGYFFHACLLLVLFCWKPSTDDSALFYVIAAAWGACHAMWETLLFALITLTHVGHVVAVSARIQSLRFVGMGLTFAAHGVLYEQAKITIMFVLLCVAVVPYGMLEVRLEAQRRNHHVQM